MMPLNEDVTRNARDSWGAATAHLIAAVRAFPGNWDAPSDCGDWTDRQLLAHLATGYVVRLAVLRAAVDAHPMPPPVDVDDANDENVRAFASMSIDAIAGRILAVRREVRALLGRIAPGHLDLQTPLEAGSVRQALPVLSRHDLEHLAQLRLSPRAPP